MKAIEIKKNVYWVGAIDWDIRNFHGYLTQAGSTYNAYLIIDKKITLIDTVKSYLAEEMLTRISSIIKPQDIDLIISNHVEMDHSGSLPFILEHTPQAEVFTSFPSGEKGLKLHYNTQNWHLQSVKAGDSVSLGKRSLQFIPTPMIHWPDNMVSYCPEENILFSNDAFGQHIACSERFCHELPLAIVLEEAKKYYANIVLPYSKQVNKALEALGSLNIDYICPSHGLIWQENIPAIIKEYQKWSTNTYQNKAVIIYDSMWHSTQKIAQAIHQAFSLKNIPSQLLNLTTNHISDIMTQIIDAKYICIGSPTLNNNIMPTVSAFLTYLKGLTPKNRTGLAFGSYGWSGQSTSQIEEVFQQMDFHILPSIKHNYIPFPDHLNQITSNLLNQL